MSFVRNDNAIDRQQFLDWREVGMPVFNHYNLVLVILSYAVSVLGSYTALQLGVGIAQARSSSQRIGTVMAAALAMGGGAIWAMHFIAMLAYQMPYPVSYDIGKTVLSALIAVAACALGLGMSGTGVFSWTKLTSAGCYMGFGVAGMHYLGMSAMIMPADIIYAGGIVTLSVVIGVVASIAALWLAFNMRGKWQMFGSAMVMGVAVCGMHYTGMWAATFVPDEGKSAVTSGVRGDYLGVIIFGLATTLLIGALVLNIMRQQRRASITI